MTDAVEVGARAMVDCLFGAGTYNRETNKQEWQDVFRAGLAAYEAVESRKSPETIDNAACVSQATDKEARAMVKPELLPCPFCGGADINVVYRDVEPQGDPWYGKNKQTFVECDDCGYLLNFGIQDL